MKTNTHANRARHILPLALLQLFIAWTPAPAAAQGVFYSTREVLGAFFATSGKVTYEQVITKDEVAALRAQLGYTPIADKYVVFVARTADVIDGYAVVDDEKGQHLPITMATALSPGGVVTRTEVMVYREGHGDEIREARFRRQFVGRGAKDAIAMGRDVVAISGATISAHAMARAVKRAVALVSIVRARIEPTHRASSASATTGAAKAAAGQAP